MLMKFSENIHPNILHNLKKSQVSAEYNYHLQSELVN